MNWTIRFHSPEVEQFLLDLPDGLLACYLRLIDLIRADGPHLGMPHTRAMRGGLFELRLSGREGIGRLFFCTAVNRQIIFLHGFIKKSERTPLRELEKARQRLKEANSRWNTRS